MSACSCWPAVFSIARPAAAQTEGGCTLLPGQTAPDDPSVTAQQVEDGSATLEEFALAVRERSREHTRVATTVEEGVYIGCIIRVDDGIWRSGSTYIVSLTPDGRVFIHAKDMALSGRLLNPVIYGTILTALGVSPSDLTNLASPDPATAAQAFGAVIGTLSQEPDGAFDATGPIPGLSPGIPGASGHAAVYVSADYGAPIILLTGFDINESHLVSIDDESIDYGDPAITAEDVVDRRTLKAFVTQAGEWFLELQRTGDVADASKARIALRDPNGPWRHGSVYLYVLDLSSNIILFHGVFPDRFEYRPLVPTVTDAVTGEFILPQVIEAAKGSPEGGFVEYYFDNPTDDTDSADIPKVGYAREFAAEIRRPDGITFAADFIVGSGFYLAALPTSGEQFDVDEEIPDMPTGVWSPDLLSRASFSQVGGQTSITFSHGGRIEEDGVAYTCMSSGGCEIEGTRVAKGTILVSERAAQGDLLVTGAAELVDVWTEFQGEIYNGYELDGSTATFRSAAGEITRVSFLDPGGDLVFIDFSSDDPATEVVITLEDYSGSLEDSPYDQPGTQYGRGLATISVVNPTETTWLSVFSAGNRYRPGGLGSDRGGDLGGSGRWYRRHTRDRHRRHGQHRNDRCEQCQPRRIIRGDRYRCDGGHGQAGPVDWGHHPGGDGDAASADQCGVARPCQRG